MGDRCVFGFRESEKNKEETVWLYSHWGGFGRSEDLAVAIYKAQPRWADASYATRIAVSQIIGDAWNSETGYGLSAGSVYTGDNEYDHYLVVNWDDRTVTAEGPDGTAYVTYGFEAYLNLYRETITTSVKPY